MTGEKTWRREVGFCFTADGRDIQREIVEMGAALACARYSTRYVMFEQADAVAIPAALILLHPALGLIPHRAGAGPRLFERLLARETGPTAAVGPAGLRSRNSACG